MPLIRKGGKNIESGTANIATRLTGALTSGLDLPSNLVESINNTTGADILKTLLGNAAPAADLINAASSYLGGPTTKNPVKSRDILKSATGSTEEQLQPQGFGEKIAHNIVEGIPLTAATIASGGAAIPAAISNVGSGIGSAAGENLGGTPGAIAGALAGGIGANRLYDWLSGAAKAGTSPQTLKTIAKEAETTFYNAEKELGKDIKVSSVPYKDNLNRIEKEIARSKALNDTERKSLLKVADLMKEDLRDIDTNASFLVQADKDLNKLYKTLKSPGTDGFINSLKAEVENAAKNISTTSEKANQWYNAWHNAKDTHKALNYRTYMGDIYDKYPKVLKTLTSPLAKSLLGVGALGLGGIPGIFLGGLGYGLTKGAGKAAEIYGFLKYPRAQELLKQAFEYSFQRNIPALTRTYQKINNVARQYERETSKGGRLIRRAGDPI